jgi:hypothetical protein
MLIAAKSSGFRHLQQRESFWLNDRRDQLILSTDASEPQTGKISEVMMNLG